MGNRLVQKTASVLMAFVLVCTCNSATMQPLAAFAVQGGDVPAETQETPAGDEPQGVAPGVEKKASQGDEPQGDVPEGQGGSVPDGTGEGLVGEFEPIVEGSEAPQPEKGQGEGSGVPHEVCGLDVSGEWDDDAQTVAWSIRVGEPASPEVDLSGYQLTLSFDDRLVMGQASLGDGRAVEAIGERAPGSFAYRFAADGDDLPLAPQTLTVTMKASSALLDALAAAEKTGDRVAVELDARLEAVEDAPALLDAVSLEERAEVVLKEAVEAPLLVEPPSVDEVAAIDEALAADEVQAPARPALTRMLRTSANENDVTNEIEQLSLGVVDFSYVDVAGVTHIIPAVQSTDKSVEYDFSSIPLASIDHMNMEVDFQIKKDDASRTINAGDIFKYDVPSIFTVADNPDPQDIVSPTGEVLATYTIEDNQVVVTFTETVDIEKGNVGIVGGISCSFKLNDDELQADKPTDADMVLQTGGTTYTFTAPKKSTDLVGIEKAGTYDRDKCAITWTVTVGSDPQSVGVPLKGITIVDKYDKAKQGKADVTDAGGTPLSVTETDTGFEYTFPEDSVAVAPYELKVTVPVQDAVLDAAVSSDQELSNQVTMSSPKESSIQVAGEPGATGTVEVPKFSFSKQGTPLNSSTIAWELTVNQGGVGAANDVVVYDRLDARATYKDGTLTLDGQKIDDVYETAPDPAPASTYAVLAKEAGGTWLLEVHIAGTVSTERRIAFETEIDASGHKNENIDFPNEAWITYRWPNGYGPGIPPTPIAINTDFQVAYLNKETPSYDPSTGEITWSIVPSIRTDEYNRGIITDTIADDQEYIDGSVKVSYQGVELSSEQLPGVFSYSEPLKTLVFSFARDDYSLNDVAIEYRTQALNFKNENMEHHLYENTANLVVESAHGEFTAEDTASRSFRNEFLAKTSSYEVVDDQSGSTGYLHYRIVANASHMPSANLEVTDDLSSLVTKVVAADDTELDTIEAGKWSIAEGENAIKVTEIAKDGSESVVTDSYSTEEWKTKRKIEAIFSGADKTTNAYRIDLYLTLDRSVLQELHKQYPGEFVIRAQNAASAKSDDFNGGEATEVTCEGTAGEGEIDNRLVAKSVDGSQQSEGILAYRININPNGADMQNVTLTDVPDGVLAIDLGSVQLHRATHGADGAIADALGNAVDASIWSKKLVHDAASGNTALSVGLPNGTASYVLTYEAHVVGAVKDGKISNNVTLTADGGQTGSDTCVAEVDAGSWGWLTKKAVYKLVKADEFGEKASPIAGVTFNLYRDVERKDLVATSVSNAKGLVAFYGLDVNATYYYDEPEASSGYQALAFDSETNKFTTGDAGSNVIAGTATLNKRTTSDVAVELKKTFVTDVGDTLNNPRSTFKLYLYPNGFGNGKKVAVRVTGSDGSYAYAATDGTDELKNGDTGTISISGLPWGDYGLEEVKPQAGYAAYEGMKRFSVVRLTDDSSSWSVNYAPGTSSDVGAEAKIANEKTSITVKKTTDASKSLEGAVLSIRKDNSGEPGDVLDNLFKSDKEYSVTLDSSAGAEFTWDLKGIPAGTYWLCEDTMPTDQTVGKFEDVQFKIDVYGKLTVLNGKGSVQGSVLSVVDDPNRVSVKKLDQWGKAVIGATLQLQVKDGSSWSSVGDPKTTDGSELSFDGLERGKTYRIVETGVPAGYATANHGTVDGETQQMVEFTINEYGAVASDPVLHNGSAPTGTSNGNFLNLYHDNNSFTMRNERIVGHAEFVKLVDGTTPLAGVQFDLYQKSASGGSDILVNSGHFTSDSNGKVSTLGSSLAFASGMGSVSGESIGHGLPVGTYYFKEAATHSDFAFDTENPLVTDEFTVSADSNRYTWKGDGAFGDVVTVTKDGGAVANVPLNASVRILKAVEGDGLALSGAVFSLTGKDANGDNVSMTATSAAAGTEVRTTDSAGVERTYKTTADGEALFANVPAGTYTVKETVPPPGYKLTASEWQVTVDQATRAVGTVYALNDGNAVANEQNGFSISKRDAVTGEGVAGAAFKLSGTFADGKSEPLTWISTAEAHVIAGKLVASTTGNEQVYTLEETSAPAHYVAAPPIELKMDAEGKLYQRAVNAKEWQPVDDNGIVVQNDPVRGHVALTKTVADGADGTVEGVRFSLYKAGAGEAGGDLLVAEGLATDGRGSWTSVGKGGVSNPDTGQTLDKGLAVGSYYFVETAATPDTVLDGTAHHEFEIGDGNHYAATSTAVACDVANKAFSASLTFAKLDATTGDPLTGATFELHYAPEGGGEAQTIELTEQEAGVFTKTGLKKGSYVLKETGVPTGYKDAFEAKFALSDADGGTTVEIKEGAETSVGAVEKTAGTWSASGVTNTRVLGSMSVAKTATGTGTPLEGAEFELTGPGDYREILTTDADGKAAASALAWGDYVLKEVKAPAGYRLGAQPYFKELSIGPNALSLDLGSVENEQTNVSIAKVDDDGNELAGARLKLSGTFADGTDEKTWTSGKDAEPFVGKLVVGNTYVLTETDRLSGYRTWTGQASFKLDDAGKIVLDEPSDQAAAVSTNGLQLSLSNTRIAAAVELVKTRDGASPLQGVVFDLYAEGAEEPLETDLVTDQSGKATVTGLPEGSYYFVETATPDSAVVDETHWTFSIGEKDHGQTVRVDVDNKSFKTAVSVLKVDGASGEALPGAQFALYKQASDGTFAPVGSPLAANESGAVAFTLAEGGTYRIQETQAAPGYVLDAESPYTATFTVENTDEFQGKTLELSENVGQDIVATYRLTVENAQYKDGSVANERKLGSIALSKVSKGTGERLSGAEFELAGPEGYKAMLTTGDDGTLSVEGLAWGVYSITETKAPDGYQLGPAPYCEVFAIGADNADSVPAVDLGLVENEPIALSFDKLELYAESCSDPSLGADGPDAVRPLAGAEFTLYEDEACTKVARLADGGLAVASSGADGEVAFERIVAGSYFAKETAVPAGHVDDSTVYALGVREDGVIERFAPLGEDGVLDAVVNDVHRADIRIKKVSENDEGKALPGSTYGLYRRAPAVALASLAAPFSSDAFGGASAGALVGVLDGGLQLIAKATTDQNGYLTFKGVLMDQEYVIQEFVAPDGSLVSKNPIVLTFSVGDDGAPKLVSFDDGSGTAEVDGNGDIVWKEPQVIVEFSKKDPDGALLAGALLQVVAEDGGAVGEPWVSEDSAGHRIEGVLAAGKTYRLVELDAPDGFLVAEDVTFTVDELARGPKEGYAQQVEMTDEREPAVAETPAKPPVSRTPFGFLVKTGDAPLGLLAGGVALAAAGAAAAAGVRRRRKQS